VAVPTTSRPPQPSDYTVTNVSAVARPDGTVQITWNAPRVAPASYRILRADNDEQLSTSDAAATSAIIGGLPLGQPLSFVVESVVPGTPGFRSAPSPLVSAYGPPGAPDIVGASIPVRQPHMLTVTISVSARNTGGSAITQLDLAITDGRGTRAQASVPFTQTLNLDISCGDINDLCMSGGGITIFATVHNGAGAGPRRTATANIPGQAAFQYSQENRAYFPVQIVTSGLKCWNNNFTLQSCNPNDGGQQWTPMDRGYVSAASNPTRACITRGSGTLLRLNNGSCADDSRRWHRGEPGNLSHLLRNQENDRYCIFVTDPNAEGAQVGYRNCQFNAAEVFHYFLPSQPVGSLSINQVGAAAAAVPVPARLSTADGGLGAPVAVLLLVVLPVAARATRRRRR
jgi:hypothetical protein